MNWGIPIGIAVATTVLVLAFWKPVLARMGIGYAFERKQQTALIVAGLMIATTVIAAAGIAADSSGASFAESMTAQLGPTDAVVDAWLLPGRDALEQIATASPFSEDVEAYSARLDWQMPFEAAQSGNGDTRVTHGGIDPETYSQVATWKAIEGVAPASLAQWPQDSVVLNERAAKEYGIGIGESVNIFLGDETVPVDNVTVYDGHFVLEAQSAVGVPVSHPENVATFTHPMESMDYYQIGREVVVYPLTFYVDAPSGTEVQLTVTDPNRQEYQSEMSDGHVELIVEEPLNYGPSNWTLEVTTQFAQDVDFNVTVIQIQERIVDDRVFAYTVAGIIEQEGSEPLWNQPVVFLPRHELQAMVGLEDQANTLFMAFNEDADLQSIRDQLDQETELRVEGGWSRMPRLEVVEERKMIELATQAVFLGIGSFSIITGFMLIGVLMALLVEERKRILATARALGAQRSHLTIAASHEGSLYALFAAFAGLLGATALAAAIMSAANSVMESEGARGVMVVKMGTVLGSIGFGFSLTLLVIALAAYRTTRLHIAAALKDEEVDPKQGRIAKLILSIILIFVGAVLLITSFVTQNALALSLGPCFLLLGIGPLVAKGQHRNLAMAVMGGVLTAYLIASFWFIKIDDEADFISFPLRAVLLAISVATVAAYSTILHRGVNAIARLSKRAGPLIEAAVANLGRKPGRSAMTIAMFSMVLIILTTLGTMFATFEPNDLGDAGGFDVLADTDFDLGDPVQYLEENPPSSGIDPFEDVRGWVTTPWSDGVIWNIRGEGDSRLEIGFGSSLSYSVMGVTPEFAEEARFKSIDAGGLSKKEALQKVATDPTGIILPAQARLETDSGKNVGIKIGQQLYLKDQAGDRPLVVVGFANGVGATGAMLNADVFTDWMEDRFGGAGTRIWIDAPGRDHTQVATQFESAFRRASMEATDVDNINAGDAEASRAFQFVISLFLGLGIIIGMVALALIMGRNVLLRRAEIGTLRAVGAKPWQILLMFSFEALYLTVFAIIIGFSVGLLLAWRMIGIDEIWVPLRVDWAGLAILYTVTLVAAIGTALIPALRASRIPPAVAVRHVE